MQSFLNDLSWHAETHIHIDASAARSTATRQSTERVMHLQVQHLWLQALLEAGAVKIGVVKGKINPADVMIKIQRFLEAGERFQLVGLILV
jgi:hypothetical protein